MHVFVQEGKERSREGLIYSARKCFEEPEEVLFWIKTS